MATTATLLNSDFGPMLNPIEEEGNFADGVSPTWQSYQMRALHCKQDKPRPPGAEIDFELVPFGKIGGRYTDGLTDDRRLSVSTTVVDVGGEQAEDQDNVQKYLDGNRIPSEVKKRSYSISIMESGDRQRNIKDDSIKQGCILPILLLFALAGLSGLLFGYDTGYISGIMAMDYVQNLQL